MTAPNIRAKEISSGHGDRLIRVLAANQKTKGFNATTFSEIEIERVMEIDEDRSALVLRSGVEIPVAIPYEQLEQKIYQPNFRNDGLVLDLRDVTGEVAQAKPPPANDSAEPKIGDRMPDGTVFAGISPESNKPMFATPVDAPLTMNFNKAAENAAQLDAHGHQDWRVPTKAELNVLFNNRAAISGFNVTGSAPAGWYWSASHGHEWSAWGQRFSDGYQFINFKDDHLAVRFVR